MARYNFIFSNTVPILQTGVSADTNINLIPSFLVQKYPSQLQRRQCLWFRPTVWAQVSDQTGYCSIWKFLTNRLKPSLIPPRSAYTRWYCTQHQWCSSAQVCDAVCLSLAVLAQWSAWRSFSLAPLITAIKKVSWLSAAGAATFPAHDTELHEYRVGFFF